MNFDWGMKYTVGKILLKAIEYCPHVSKQALFKEI
jgi:ribosomal protein L33